MPPDTIVWKCRRAPLVLPLDFLNVKRDIILLCTVSSKPDLRKPLSKLLISQNGWAAALLFCIINNRFREMSRNTSFSIWLKVCSEPSHVKSLFKVRFEKPIEQLSKCDWFCWFLKMDRLLSCFASLTKDLEMRSLSPMIYESPLFLSESPTWFLDKNGCWHFLLYRRRRRGWGGLVITCYALKSCRTETTPI